MPRQRNFDSLYKSLNVHHEQETPRIHEEELPSNNLSQSDHSMCDFLFEDYKDGKGRLLWKGKLYRLDAEQNKKFREMLLKDLEGEE
ncbi:MAG: hypothetical protein ACOCM4_02130 [Acetivibrio ethanolgignens]